MAEFCLECLNRINETNDKSDKYLFSDELYLCEGCGEYKKVAICEKNHYLRFFGRFKTRVYLYLKGYLK